MGSSLFGKSRDVVVREPPAPVVSTVEPVTAKEPAARESRIASRARAKKLSTRRATILTSPQGLPSLLTGDKETTKKALGA